MTDNKQDTRIGVYICHCGSNIAGTVDVEKCRDDLTKMPGVTIVRDYKFMCSEPGQDLIIKDIKEQGLNRVVVASCSPLMHEPTFRKACEKAGLNRYLFQMVNIREQCSWVHKDSERATQKASSLTRAAIQRVSLQQPLTPVKVNVHPDTLIVGGGIAGIQAALEIAESGNKVFLVEKESTIGGKMARFDKTFPTLDCSACILTPKMVSASQHDNIELISYSEVEAVDGAMGDFKVKVRKKARYVKDDCTSCGECSQVCPVKVPNPFEENQSTRSAIYKTFPQAIPNTFVVEKEGRPPCRETCPIDQEAAGYIGLIAEKRFEEAARLIRHQNVLPSVCGRVCYHPCETECNRKFVDDPVAIKNLKRFVIDWERAHIETPHPPEIPEKRPEKVAIIGSGPAGLVCAHDLARQGFQAAIFEKLPVAGGMLAVGIPEYRLPAEILESEINAIKQLGVTVKTKSALGKDFTLEDLKQEFKAVYIATGAHNSLKMEIPGEAENEGVYHGVDFLRNIRLNQPQPVGKQVAVIGGGNTAEDAARTAIRSGAEEVTILYRRTRKEMPAEEAEIHAAEAEGIKIQYLTAPVEVIGQDGKLTRLKNIKMELGKPDESGRRRPVPIEGSEYEMDMDTVIIAVSQSPEMDFVDDKTGLKLTKWNTIVVDPETMQSDLDWVFSGGDVVHGPDAVITAMGDGKRAAESIGKYLRKEPLENFQTRRLPSLPERDENSRPHSYAAPFNRTQKAPRTKMRELDPLKRVKTFDEVELGYSEEEAVQEAKRCLHCGICIECRACETACEAHCIDHAMEDEIKEINVGQILVTTGYQTLLKPDVLRPFGYGTFDDVYTSLEFERIVSSTGPTEGSILLKNGKPPKSIGIVHCVGSRDINAHEYCSRVCCMYALKFAHLIKDRTNAEVFQFYIDMRAFGKGYEEFYSRILEEDVNVIRGKVAEVYRQGYTQNGDSPLIIRCEDTLAKRYREIPVDMVILCNAIEPTDDAEQIQRLFSLSRSPDGFFLEKHPKLDPTATATDGVYVAGCCQGPKDIPDTVAQASSASARILANIAKGEIEVEPIQAVIDPDLCAGCRLCNDLCSYGAIYFDEEKKVSVVREALCKGCGTCVACCPSSAAVAQHFSDDQIFAEIEGILKDSQ